MDEYARAPSPHSESGPPKPSDASGDGTSSPPNGARRRVTRALKVVMGFTVLVAGVLMLVLPGPGWVVIAVGLAILAGEFVWAKRLLDKLKAGANKVRESIRTK